MGTSQPEQLELFDQPLPEKLERLTFNQAMRLFVAIHWSKTKMGGKTGALVGHLVTFFDGRLIDTLGRQDIVNLRAWLSKKGFGLAYVNKGHTITKLLYNKFYAWTSDGWADGYNFSKLKLPKMNPADMVPKPRDPARERFLTPWEFKKLIKYSKQVNDWDLVDLIRMALWCRLSPIDLENLNDSEISESRFQIELRRRHTMTPRNPQGCLQIIPLKEKMWGLIHRRRQYRKPGDQRLLNFTNIKRRLNKVRKKAVSEGMEDFTLRDFRRSGSGFLYEKGFSMDTIAEGMGHVDPKTTRQHYIPKNRPHLAKPTEVLVEAFDG